MGPWPIPNGHHAWVEIEPATIYDGVTGRFYDRTSYYETVQAVAEAKYSVREAAERVLAEKVMLQARRSPAAGHPTMTLMDPGIAAVVGATAGSVSVLRSVRESLIPLTCPDRAQALGLAGALAEDGTALLGAVEKRRMSLRQPVFPGKGCRVQCVRVGQVAEVFPKVVCASAEVLSERVVPLSEHEGDAK